ncbi:MAG: tetratricopeptide repeat protein [Planctomycetota bacterium]
MKCPVCPKTDISAEAQECPNCGTDLTPVRRLRELCAAQFNEALRLADAGATDAAMARAAAALSLDDEFVPARKLLGKLLLGKGRVEEAIAQWEQAAAQCPEDGEVQRLLSSGRELKSRRLVKRASTIAVGILVASLVLFGLPYVHYRTASRRVDTLLSPLAELQEYRKAHSRPDSDYTFLRDELAKTEGALREASFAFSRYRGTHSRSDADYAVLKDEKAQIEKAHADLMRAFTRYRETHSRADSDYAFLQDKLTRTEESLKGVSARVEDLAAQLAEERATGEQVRQALEEIRARVESTHGTMHERHRRVLELAADMHETLRPPEADELTVKVEECRQKIDRLVAARKDYESRALVGMRAIEHFCAGQKLKRARKRLRSLEGQYAERVRPWEKSMHALQAALRELEQCSVGGPGATKADVTESENP